MNYNTLLLIIHQKSQNKEPETPVKILRSSLTDDCHKLLSWPTSSIGFSRSNNYGFYTSSAHIYRKKRFLRIIERNKVRGSHNNINIDEFVLKQSDEGSYLDKFSESTKKTIHNEDIINKYVKSEAVYANTLNNDLVFSINSNPILSLDNFRVLNSNWNSRKNSKEKSNSKESMLLFYFNKEIIKKLFNFILFKYNISLFVKFSILIYTSND